MMPFMDLKTLGAQIRSLRAKRGLKQRDVATLAGCSHTYISALETGVLEGPTFSMVEKIVSALGGDLDVEVTPREAVRALSVADAAILDRVRRALPGVPDDAKMAIVTMMETLTSRREVAAG